nr:MAG TPA: hypothetical protein [Caudoviricetes sp.]
MLDFLYITLVFIWFSGRVGTVVKLYISCMKGESDE